MKSAADKDKFTVAWSSPSNIALIKYWGKRPVQLPENPSVSFTLGHCVSHLQMSATPKKTGEMEIDFFYEDQLNTKFQEKIVKFLSSQSEVFPWLTQYKLVIHSTNTFPHSSGIASSASSMSALNLCVLTLDEMITGKKLNTQDFFQKASELSRLASGSAGRSVYPFMSSWGLISNDYASPVRAEEIHPDFHHYCDSILIVDEGEKAVSSRAGHALMEKHPFRQARFEKARQNMQLLLTAMKEADMKTFIEIVEEEALMLHALMMTSTPSYILLKPQSLFLIDKIRSFRAASNIPVCFTIDAGPNIHLLYPALYKEQVRSWLSALLPEMKIIHDEVGQGPIRHLIHEP